MKLTENTQVIKDLLNEEHYQKFVGKTHGVYRFKTSKKITFKKYLWN